MDYLCVGNAYISVCHSIYVLRTNCAARGTSARFALTISHGVRVEESASLSPKMSTLALFASSSLVLLLLAAASALDCFGAEEYAASAFRVPDTNCRRIGNNSSSSGNSSFKLCALSAAEDWISEAVLLRRSQWQPGVVAAVSAAVRTAGAAGDNDVVLVDVGAHIGSVAVPVAAANEHAR